MAGWTRDNDDGDKFELERNGEAAPSSAPVLRNLDAPGPSTLVRQDSNGWANGEAPSTSLIQEYVRMGFPEEMVVKGIKDIGHCDANALLELLLTYKALGDEDALGNCSTSSCARPSVEDGNDNDLDFDIWDDDDDTGGREHNSDSSGNEDGNRFLDGSHDEPILLPNPMVGFNLPGYRRPSVMRMLPQQAIGPPFFYYENVALAPKGVWENISRFLYDIEPEFVDSMHLCAASMKRGYIHNLPIENRSPLLPLPPKTIFEAFPHYKKWWPSWDQRRQLNCLETSLASSWTIEEIQSVLAQSGNPPPPSVQKYVMNECRKWNLVWAGENKVAPLEPNEVEYLLGFPRDHTRGVGKIERYESLGCSFHVDTVAYHFSVLRDMFPNGVSVLSLFTGVGGGEVALHRLGIHMRAVVSVEISEASRRILRGWWDQTQTGTLIEIADVKSLTPDIIASFVGRFGGFDLVIGGSSCNSLTGSNQHHHDGLVGEQSYMFFEFVKILGAVKSAMARM